MPESVTLSIPVNAVPATPRWIITDFNKHRDYVVSGSTITANPAGSVIKVALIGENGHRKSHAWTGTTADALILALNKANMNPAAGGITENNRILNRLIADGVIDGTPTGTPD